jgi:protein ImuA
MSTIALQRPESIHPSLWRGTQLASARAHCIETGDARLSAELPGGGWPAGSLIELMIQQPGVGELRLLRPALEAVSGKPLMLLEPPHLPNHPAFAHWGLPLEQLSMVRAPRAADALWAAEQILRAGSCGALLLWQNPIRSEALRRLHLAAQSSETLFFLFRPLSAARHTSPAPLRIALEPVEDGLALTFVKRRGPFREQSLHIPLMPSPILLNRHAALDRRLSATPAARSVPANLVI